MNEGEIRAKVYLARSIFEAGRPSDSYTVLKTLIESEGSLTAEWSLITSVWQEIIDPIRTAIMNMDDVRSPNTNIPLATQALKDDLNAKLSEMSTLLEEHLIPASVDEETKGIFIKTLADFQRYRLECVDKESFGEVSASARANYVKAIDIFRTLPKQSGELVMSAQLNYAILLADYLNQEKKAVEIISQNIRDLDGSLDKFPEEEKEALRDLLDVMMDNLERWKPTQQQEEETKNL